MLPLARRVQRVLGDAARESPALGGPPSLTGCRRQATIQVYVIEPASPNRWKLRQAAAHCA